ncbi:hypothetical protein GF386_04865 [Candidatus Pacearchaeota archaeon]|nr:hypothetical protein [Candidatus Pacearchaeota archaeon]MBD3283444.1 hypothetical protein [Candidatus Pacearchaeota archaeon]
MEIQNLEIKKYLERKFKGEIKNIKIEKLGTGVLGIGYLLEFEYFGKKQKYVLKSMFTENLGMDHFSDRAAILLLAHDSYNNMKNHVKSEDVISVDSRGELKSVGDSREYFILMKEAKGKPLFETFNKIREAGKLEKQDRDKIILLSNFLVDLHKQKKESISLYRRKIRDTIGSGASIMGVLDMYPEKEYNENREQWLEIIKISINYWNLSKDLSYRNSEIHGDYHPGNLWFEEEKLTILDRSRGKTGEPADDIASFLINPILYCLIKEDYFKGVFKEVFDIFWNNYFKKTKDREMRKIIAPYFAFRTAVVCNPLFYNDDFFGGSEKAGNIRRKLIKFSLNILRDNEFKPEKINHYINNR